MKRTTVAILVAGFVVVAVAALVMLLVLFRPASPFEGEHSIDLGTKALAGGEAVWSDSFQLRNISGTAVHVLALRPNCKCIDADLPRSVIPAGEWLEIPFTITLERPGERVVYIDVILPEENIEELRISAVATE